MQKKELKAWDKKAPTWKYQKVDGSVKYHGDIIYTKYPFSQCAVCTSWRTRLQNFCGFCGDCRLLIPSL